MTSEGTIQTEPAAPGQAPRAARVGGLQFGVNLSAKASADDVLAVARAAERDDIDVLGAPDHLGACAPFTALATAAAVTSRIRLRTYVLDVYFWNPALLAREAATLDLLSGGRLDLGLGAGHMKHEHDDAGLPFPPHAERVAALESMLLGVRRRLGGDHVPPPVQRRVPVAVGGWGAATLGVAARHADIVALTGALQAPGRPVGTLRLASSAETAERVATLRDLLAAERPADAPEPVLDALLQLVVVDRPPEQAAEEFRAQLLAAGRDDIESAEELLDTPFALFAASPQDAVAELLRRRERYGITSWFTHARSASALGAVAAAAVRPAA
jgi:probable F420-dependent oxidoreductase